MDLGNTGADLDSVHLNACFGPYFKARQLKPLNVSIIVTKIRLD